MGFYKIEKLTTYNHPTSRRLDQLKQYGVQAMNQRIVLDRNSIASSNPDTAFDVAFMLSEIVTSIKNTKRVEELMGFDEQIG